MIKITKTDRDKEENGVWTSYEGVSIRVARVNNAFFLKALREKAKQTVEGNIRDMSEEKSDAIMVEVMAEHTLKEWKPFDYDGQKIEHDFDNAVSLLTHDPDFRDYVADFSRNPANFMQDPKDDPVAK